MVFCLIYKKVAFVNLIWERDDRQLNAAVDALVGNDAFVTTLLRSLVAPSMSAVTSGLPDVAQLSANTVEQQLINAAAAGAAVGGDSSTATTVDDDLNGTVNAVDAASTLLV